MSAEAWPTPEEQKERVAALSEPSQEKPTPEELVVKQKEWSAFKAGDRARQEAIGKLREEGFDQETHQKLLQECREAAAANEPLNHQYETLRVAMDAARSLREEFESSVMPEGGEIKEEDLLPEAVEYLAQYRAAEEEAQKQFDLLKEQLEQNTLAQQELAEYEVQFGSEIDQLREVEAGQNRFADSSVVMETLEKEARKENADFDARKEQEIKQQEREKFIEAWQPRIEEATNLALIEYMQANRPPNYERFPEGKKEAFRNMIEQTAWALVEAWVADPQNEPAPNDFRYFARGVSGQGSSNYVVNPSEVREAVRNGFRDRHQNDYERQFMRRAGKTWLAGLALSKVFKYPSYNAILPSTFELEEPGDSYGKVNDEQRKKQVMGRKYVRVVNAHLAAVSTKVLENPNIGLGVGDLFEYGLDQQEGGFYAPRGASPEEIASLAQSFQEDREKIARADIVETNQQITDIEREISDHEERLEVIRRVKEQDQKRGAGKWFESISEEEEKLNGEITRLKTEKLDTENRRYSDSTINQLVNNVTGLAKLMGGQDKERQRLFDRNAALTRSIANIDQTILEKERELQALSTERNESWQLSDKLKAIKGRWGNYLDPQGTADNIRKDLERLNSQKENVTRRLAELEAILPEEPQEDGNEVAEETPTLESEITE